MLISWPRESLKTFFLAILVKEKERNWNWLLPGKSTCIKNCSGYMTDDGIHGYLLESFLQLASVPDSLLTTLHEDNFVKVIPVFIAKDAM